MMRSELESRVGPLEDWQWEMAHAVYQEHGDIKDCGGKDQIAEIVKKGFTAEWPDVALIRRMYADIKGKPIITHSDSDMYSTWDVTHEHYCVNTQPRTANDVYQKVRALFESQYQSLNQDVEYFSSNREPVLWPEGARVAIFYVRGGSEGYYVHVEALQGGHNINMMLVKTLREGSAGIEWAEATANALSRIMHP
jgi:hypothetical protein